MTASAPLLRHILCALDVEAPAKTALGCAGTIAERFRASLDAVHAPAPARAAAVERSGVRRLDQLMTAHAARERLRELVESMPGAVRATPYVVEGRPSSVILSHAERQHADLIVLGSRPRTRFEVHLGNAVGYQVPSQAGCAVLTARESRSSFAIRSILLPTDFSACTSLAIDWAIALATEFGAGVHVLHVITRGSTSKSIDRLWRRTESTVPASAALELRGIEGRLRAHGVEATRGVRFQSGVASAILELTDATEFDLVIMGLHGRPRRADCFAPGVVASVRGRAAPPLLSLRAAEPEVAFAGSGFTYEPHDSAREASFA